MPANNKVRRLGKIGVTFSATAALLVACGGGNNSAPPSTPPNAQTACDGLNGLAIAGGSITATALVPAIPASGATPSVPEYCKVTAKIFPKLNFEVRLPSTWNNKLHYSGGGGTNGSITAINSSAVNQGYVDVASDSGHSGSPVDASFAASDDHALLLFASLSVPTVTAATIEIIQKRYGALPTRSYFEGCSNGGREGLMAAQRNPTLFDGIIAKAPARQFVASQAASQRTLRLVNALPSPFSAAKLKLVGDSVLAACDTVVADGVVDGIISNPKACNFDVSKLRCAGGADTGDTCLSDAQIGVMNSITTPITAAGGAVSFPGMRFAGEEATTGSWMATYLTPIFSTANLFYSSIVPNMIARDPTINALAFDFDANAAAVKTAQSLIDVIDPNFSVFAQSGRKLIMWQGTSDALVPPTGTNDFYSSMVNAAGGQAQADSFMRYYTAPGVMHCAGGSGADQTTQLLATLDAWVTKSAAPATLTAAKVNPTTGATVFTRPLCVFPGYPRYNGTGDVNAAASYSCVVP